MAVSRRVSQFAGWWDDPRRSGALALLVYALIALRWNASWQATATAYFNYLADALLHGQLYLRLMPPIANDLVAFNGHYFLYWPPLPALLLLPFVALFGVNFSDILFTLGLGAFNVALVSAVLRAAQQRGVINLDLERRGWLVMFFALGTVHVTLASFGRVWFTGQVVAFGCVALTYLAALRLEGWTAFVCTGAALAAAMLTRNHLFLAGLWPLLYLIVRQRADGWLRVGRNVAMGLLPLAIALGLFGLYNWLRFGSSFDNGLAYHQMDAFFRADYEQFGVFNLHYLPINLFYQYLAYPLPYHAQTFMGGGLFWLSPLFLAAFWGVAKGRPRWSVGALVVTIALVATPILLLMGTGWMQFGPRYTLDFTLPLLLLTALGMQYWSLRWIRLAVMLSILQYVWGLIYWGAFIHGS